MMLMQLLELCAEFFGGDSHFRFPQRAFEYYILNFIIKSIANLLHGLIAEKMGNNSLISILDVFWKLSERDHMPGSNSSKKLEHHAPKRVNISRLILRVKLQHFWWRVYRSQLKMFIWRERYIVSLEFYTSEISDFWIIFLV